MIKETVEDYKLKAYKQRETYISTINHDLKIPTLAQIRALELLADESLGLLNSKQKEVVNLTLDSCRSMYEMMSDILYSYKYENQDIIPAMEYFDVIKLIKDSFINFKHSITDKNIKAKIKSSDNQIFIRADKEQLYKAFENIFGYCFSSAYCKGSILCEIFKTDNNLFVKISFENPFMKYKNFESMFNKYTTSNEKLDKLGTNLRLYLAKQIIKSHNGELYLDTIQKKFLCTVKIPI